ncbi:hypothetical protein TWF281_008213 [Arthrobotrys megalospora]
MRRRVSPDRFGGSVGGLDRDGSLYKKKRKRRKKKKKKKGREGGSELTGDKA